MFTYLKKTFNCYCDYAIVLCVVFSAIGLYYYIGNNNIIIIVVRILYLLFIVRRYNIII